LQSDEIYNADTTVAYWKGLPTKTLALMNEKSALGQLFSRTFNNVVGCVWK